MKPAKPPFASDEQNRADGSVLLLTLRELRTFVMRTKFWIILAGVTVVTALAGPFHSLERLSFPARLIYWGVTAVASTVLMTFLTILTHRIAGQKKIHWLPASLIAGAIGTLPVMALIYVANRLSTLSDGASGFWAMFPYVVVPVMLINVLVSAILADKDSGPLHDTAQPATQDLDAPGAAVEQPSLLYSKLPVTLGREVVSIQAKDHYIDVTTAKGNALVLMRLSDAEQDLAALDGLRVHRSWWVSLPHVERIEKGVSGPELRMRVGPAVPVSRGQRATVRDALSRYLP